MPPLSRFSRHFILPYYVLLCSQRTNSLTLRDHQVAVQQFMEPRMRIGGQLAAGTVFANATVLQNDDVVRVLHGAEPVRDEYARTVDQQTVYGALDQLLGGVVQTRRRLVQNDQSRIFQEDAGCRQKLRLSRGDAGAVRLDDGVKAAWQRSEPGAQSQILNNVANLAVRNRRVKQGQIVAHRGVEPMPFLPTHTD